MSETAYRITVADFSGGGRTTTTAPVFQWATGQLLQFNGLELPESYHVDFGNEKTRDYTKPQLATSASVAIPDEYFLSGKPVYAFVVLSDGEGDSATEYVAEIPVIPRSKPTNYALTPVEGSVIDQTIAAANKAREDAEAWAKGTRSGEEVTEDDETYHNNAAYYADLAGSESGAAARYAGHASDMAAAAAGSATAAGQSASAAYESAGAAAQFAGEAEQAKQVAQELVDGAVETVNAARDSAVQTVNGAGTTAVNAVNDAKQTAVQTVQQEGATQTAAAKAQADAAAASATAAHTSETNAAGSARAAAASQTAAKTSEDNAKSSEDAAKESEEAAAISAEAARHAAEGVISLNFTDFDTGTTYGYGLGIKDGHPALKIYENTEG